MEFVMSSKTVAAGAALITAAALVAAPAAEAAAGRGTTHVKVTSRHTVTAPATLRPGLVHLRNDGRGEILVFRKKREGAEKLVKYLSTESRAAVKRAFTRFGFVEDLMPKANDYITLTKGTYYLVAGDSNKIKLKNIRTVTVTGRRANAVRPTYRNVRISAKGALSGATTAAPRPYLRLRNAGSALRVVTALPVDASVSDADLRAALADKSCDKLDDVLGSDDMDSYFFTVLGGKQDVTSRTTLGRGRYVLQSRDAFSVSMTNMCANQRLLTVR